MAVNTDRRVSRDVIVTRGGERHTLSSPKGLLAHSVELNGKEIVLRKDAAVPVLRGVRTQAGRVVLPAASVTFLSFTDAGNANCR